MRDELSAGERAGPENVAGLQEVVCGEEMFVSWEGVRCSDGSPRGDSGSRNESGVFSPSTNRTGVARFERVESSQRSTAKRAFSLKSRRGRDRGRRTAQGQPKRTIVLGAESLFPPRWSLSSRRAHTPRISASPTSSAQWLTAREWRMSMAWTCSLGGTIM